MLRAINLGSRNRISMDGLRALFGALGAEDVRTYVQSGNVVFRSPGAPTGLVQAIEEGIRRTLGLDVTVLLRATGELAEVVGRSPFAASGIDPVKLHVTFLVGNPDPDQVAHLAGKRFEPDELHRLVVVKTTRRLLRACSDVRSRVDPSQAARSACLGSPQPGLRETGLSTTARPRLAAAGAVRMGGRWTRTSLIRARTAPGIPTAQRADSDSVRVPKPRSGR